jgi:hypothetical protein
MSCLMLYSDGRAVSAFSSKAGSEASREYRFPDKDSWQVSEFGELIHSKAVRRLKSYFPPPHRPIDFVEISTALPFLPDGKSKQIVVREYYVASLAEKAKYPSALVLLMDRIEQIENKVSEKGTSVEPPPDCKFEKGPESAGK